MDIRFRKYALKNRVSIEAFTKSGVRLGEVRCSNDGYISNFKVNPAFRKKGVGQKILNHLISIEDLPNKLWLHAKAQENPKYQEKLESFYKSFGFERKGIVPEGTIMVLNRAVLTNTVIVAHFKDSYED